MNPLPMHGQPHSLCNSLFSTRFLVSPLLTFKQQCPVLKHRYQPTHQGAMPYINNSGVIVNANSGDPQFALDIDNYCIAAFQDRFIARTDGLSPFFTWNGVSSLVNETLTAYQFLWYATGDTTCRLNRGTIPCNASKDVRFPSYFPFSFLMPFRSLILVNLSSRFGNVRVVVC